MSVLDRLAHFQNRRDEVPNRELARDLAAKKDRAGIREIAEHLWDKNTNIAADCIKALYEVGYIDPALIGGYVEDFVKLLKSPNNRLVWGGMIALAEAARANPDAVYQRLAEIKKAMDAGSVITVDSAVKALALTASAKAEYNAAIFPTLLKHCKPAVPKTWHSIPKRPCPPSLPRTKPNLSPHSKSAWKTSPAPPSPASKRSSNKPLCCRRQVHTYTSRRNTQHVTRISYLASHTDY